ncbi:MAG: DUF6922 domain-containing protein, partial [Patescibacteria group bacterium]
MRELKDLKRTLFWEVDVESLDWRKDVEFIIGRV